LRGIHLAMAYLTASTKARLAGRSPDHASISAKNKAVVVLGGGDTGTDCVGTAIRQGAKSVVQLEILPRPPDARAPDNPWPEWPKVYQLDYGQKEAQALWGDDPRQYQMQTKRFVGDTSGSVKRLHAVQVTWRSQGGRRSASEVPGSERVIEADLVLLALGFVGSERPMLEQLGARLDERGNVWVDDDKMTSVPGVFAAGDMVRGQSLVVWAIREGRQVARAVDRYLSYGETVLPP
jgi:glutamate synthase (NADPH/NADH) small chain